LRFGSDISKVKQKKHQVARCLVVLGQSKKRPLVVENNLLHLRVVWYRGDLGRFEEVGLDHRVGLKKQQIAVTLGSFGFLSIRPEHPSIFF